MIAGITRVRNEGLILEDTIHHFSSYVDHIFLYDDCSTDDTVEIASSFDNVTITASGFWRQDRIAENTRHRKLLADQAREEGYEWVLCFDADERLVGDLPDPRLASAYRFRLFDGYMTPEWKEPYRSGPLVDLTRLWGPEYRDIIMLFRADAYSYGRPGMRQPDIQGFVDQSDVYVKHYGKCLSADHWEETCDYYATYFPKWRDKWLNRKGMAIHLQSDFGHDLLDWETVIKQGVPL